MNTRKISKLANELIMDELLGTGQNDESNFPKDILDELEFAFQDCQRKVDQLHDDPHALANLGVLKHNGTIRRILITQEEADISDVVLQILSFVAQNERENIRIRQAEGIATAKANGVKFGRPELPLPDNFHEVHKAWREKKLTLKQAAEACGMKESTFFCKVKRIEESSKLT